MYYYIYIYIVLLKQKVLFDSILCFKRLCLSTLKWLFIYLILYYLQVQYSKSVKIHKQSEVYFYFTYKFNTKTQGFAHFLNPKYESSQALLKMKTAYFNCKTTSKVMLFSIPAFSAVIVQL